MITDLLNSLIDGASPYENTMHRSYAAFKPFNNVQSLSGPDGRMSVSSSLGKSTSGCGCSGDHANTNTYAAPTNPQQRTRTPPSYSLPANYHPSPASNTQPPESVPLPPVAMQNSQPLQQINPISLNSSSTLNK